MSVRLTGDKTEGELFVQMSESFKMAASACRQLGVIQQNTDLALGLPAMIDHIAQQVIRLSTSLRMKNIEREGGLKRFSEAMGGEIKH